MDSFVCTECGQIHEGVPLDFSAAAPDLYIRLTPEERSARTEISSDQCVVDEKHFYTRGRLVIPIVDSASEFCFGSWAFVDREVFVDMCEYWTAEGRENTTGPYSGQLANGLWPFENTHDLPLKIIIQPVGVRPLFFLEQGAHPLVDLQRKGITMHRAAELARTLLTR